MLAYEDPALKGYFSTRCRYVSAEEYGSLFNSIGEARASILLDGRVVGIWRFERGNGRITYDLLGRVSKRSQRRIGERLEDMNGFLSSEPRLAGARGC